MPGLKRPRSHVEDFADPDEQVHLDHDPEDDIADHSADVDDDDLDGSESEDGDLSVRDAGRDHYEAVGKSKLRQHGSEALGPLYSGSRISRERVVHDAEEHDPFRRDYESDESFDEDDADSEENDLVETGATTDSTSVSEVDEDDKDDDEDGSWGGAQERPKPIDRAEIIEILSQQDRDVAAKLSAANKSDATKGRAVKRQRKTYDTLLNCRIRLQQGLIALNSVQALSDAMTIDSVHASDDHLVGNDRKPYAAAEEAALSLWNNLNNLRSTLKSPEISPLSPASPSTPSSSIWSRMEAHEQRQTSHRNTILSKWSQKTALLAQDTRASSQHRLDPSAKAQNSTIVDILKNQHLSGTNVAKFVQRTRIPRSCAPVQAAAGLTESDLIYDDADFYGQLLKELLESRNVDTSLAALGNDQTTGTATTAEATQAFRSARQLAKTRKDVDTKASKGRKMRYTVQEKLQNFMAPEARGTWGQRQAEELFGSLLGKRLSLDDARHRELSEEVELEDALKLFRS